ETLSHRFHPVNSVMNQRRIMMNSTQISYFTLAAYFDTGSLKYLYFMILTLLYVLILCANVLLIVIICMNRSLHEPMYLFLCSLFVNELYGSTGLFPFLLLQILSDIHTVSVPFCFLQIYCVYTYISIEFFNLAIMSYDRYLAICYPLQYNTQMTSNKVLFFGPLILIFYTYVKILKVCFSGSKQTRQKAVSTCTPHLVSLLNFSFGICFELLQSRFDMISVPNVLRIFLALYIVTCQPLLNPVLYGLKMSQIRNICKGLFCCDVNTMSIFSQVKQSSNKLIKPFI
uniref:G-protein coupled receptors family 1 profile domain-containing protein n=1 Tax=Lates calcarifer TaxID=8187 RepID=A0A4W6FBZ3_LATCA